MHHVRRRTSISSSNLDEQSLERLVESLPADQYYLDLDTAREALAARRPFNVIELASGWKADFIVRKNRAFSVEEFERRAAAQVQGTEVRIASPEDIVLSKLEWAALGESERPLRDAVGVVAVQGESLDRAYVERWVRTLGIEKQWQRRLAKLAEG